MIGKIIPAAQYDFRKVIISVVNTELVTDEVWQKAVESKLQVSSAN
jgi:hypothetical protein